MKKIISVVSTILFSFISLACFWDVDTIEMERKQFPETLELITGKFLRHSPEYYYWRVKHRTSLMATQQADPALYDDLAVAYSKLGNDSKAIELMVEKERAFPNRYETYANMGTFFIHDGQYEQGLKYINKAIEMNPEAHFGREVYQKLLVEYLLEQIKLKGKFMLPLGDASEHFDGVEPSPFYEFLVKKGAITPGEHRYKKNAPVNADVQKAIKGVLGMMRFGNYNSPVLLEALGDLLMHNAEYQAGRQLAARAYLKASFEVEDKEIAKMYRLKFQRALEAQEGVNLNNFTIKEELEDAHQFFAQISADEHQWIREGKNLDKEFAKKYFNSPEVAIKKGGSSLKSSGEKDGEDDRALVSLQGASVKLDSGLVAIIDREFAVSKSEEKKKAEIERKNEVEDDWLFPILLGVIVMGVLLLLLRFRFKKFAGSH